jgi:hypothetical protein
VANASVEEALDAALLRGSDDGALTNNLGFTNLV